MRNWRGTQSADRLFGRWLKGKSCNRGNSGNYINAWNRKVYTMIELHGVGLAGRGPIGLIVGVSNSFCQLRESGAACVCRHIFFFFFSSRSVFAGTTGFLAGFIFGRVSLARCREKETFEIQHFRQKYMLSFRLSLTGSQG